MPYDPSHAAREALEDALALVGGVSAMARLCDRTPSAVQFWRKQHGIPLTLLPVVAKATGMRKAQLRPDLAEFFQD